MPRRESRLQRVEAVEERFRRIEVKRHPQGGWTHAVRQESSSIAIYQGSFGSPEAAHTALARKKSAAIIAVMKGRPAAEVGAEQLKFL